MIKYLHTINGRPATYDDQGQIVHANVLTRISLADDLAQVSEEQAASKAWRKKRGFPNNSKYSYCAVSVPG